MTDFEKLYQECLKAGTDHVYLEQLLPKLALLAGLVYDPNKDSAMDAMLAELSQQIYILKVYDELQSFLIHHKSPRDQPQPPSEIKGVFEQLAKIDALRAGAVANYPKIIGWALLSATERGLYRP